MNIKSDSSEVLRIIYNQFTAKNTLKTELTYRGINDEVKHLTLEEVKALVEYLAGHGYVTYKHHPVFNEINITSRGIDFYLENFE